MTPTYACVLSSAAYQRRDFEACILGLQLQNTRDFAPAWDRREAVFVEWPGAPSMPATAGPADLRPTYFRDARPDDPADALAYHTVEDGRPELHILCDRILASGTADDVSEAASHEACETEGDEYANEWSDRGDGTEEPHEVCDRLQGTSYPITVTRSDGSTATVKVANFLWPIAFDNDAPAGSQVDQAHTLTHGRDCAPQGYFIQRTPGGQATVFGNRRMALGLSRHALLRHGVAV